MEKVGNIAEAVEAQERGDPQNRQQRKHRTPVAHLTGRQRSCEAISRTMLPAHSQRTSALSRADSINKKAINAIRRQQAPTSDAR